MHNLLRVYTDEIQRLLNEYLPQLSADWWDRHVLAVLTYQQQERVKQARIVDLSWLNLAALLRVLDQNWLDLSQRFNWPKEARNWLKEAQTIRNRWAHASIAEASVGCIPCTDGAFHAPNTQQTKVVHGMHPTDFDRKNGCGLDVPCTKHIDFDGIIHA